MALHSIAFIGTVFYTSEATSVVFLVFGWSIYDSSRNLQSSKTFGMYLLKWRYPSLGNGLDDSRDILGEKCKFSNIYIRANSTYS
jgi:hypothetical protein